MVTLESSLAAAKLALTQLDMTSSVNEQPVPQPETQSAGSSAATGVAELSLSRASIKSLDMQRQLDSAYCTQAMLEVVSKTNAEITARLKNLRKLTVLASNDKLTKSERALLISQFDSVRQSVMVRVKSAGPDATRLFDAALGPTMGSAKAAEALTNSIDRILQIMSGMSSAVREDDVTMAGTITATLRTQISGDTTQAALAQANYSPEAIVKTLSTKR